MTEKVFGFKEKDAKIRCCGDSKIWQVIYLKKSKFAPVVSLEWIEKRCKFNIEFFRSEEDDIVHRYIKVKDLLLAAKKEVGKNE